MDSILLSSQVAKNIYNNNINCNIKYLTKSTPMEKDVSMFKSTMILCP